MDTVDSEAQTNNFAGMALLGSDTPLQGTYGQLSLSTDALKWQNGPHRWPKSHVGH